MASKQIAHRLPVYLFSATLLILPFVFVKKALDPVLIPRFLLLSVSVLALMIWLLVKKDFRDAIFKIISPGKILVLALLAYLIVTAVSLIVAINPVEGYFEVVKTALFTQLVIIASVLFLITRSNILITVKAAVIVCVVIGIMGMIDAVKVAGAFPKGSVLYFISSTMAHKNLLASILFLGLPFSILLFFQSSTFWKTIAGINCVLSMVLIVIVQSRAVWLALMVAILVSLVLVAYARPSKIFQASKKKVVILALVVLVGIVSVYAALSIFYFPKIGQVQNLKARVTSMFHFNTVQDEHTETILERLRLWKNSWEIIKDHPVLGVGAGNWKIVFPSKGMKGLRSDQGTVNFQRPHNDFLWVWSETGLLGLLAYIAILSSSVFYAINVIRTCKDREPVMYAILSTTAILGFCTISFFDFPKERPLHLAFLAIWLAIPFSSYLETKREKENPYVAYITIVTLIAVNIIGLVVGAFRLKGEVLTRRGLAQQDSLQKRHLFEKAQSPFYKMDLMSMPLAWYVGESYFLEGDYKTALIQYRIAKHLNPFQLHILNDLGTCYFLLGQKDSAMAYYNKALEISPNFCDANFNLCVIYYNEANGEKSLHYFLQCAPDLKLERYRTLVDRVLLPEIDSIIEGVDEPQLISVLEEIKTKPEWIAKIQQDVIYTGEPLRTRMFKDALYKLEVMDSTISPATAHAWHKKYAINY